MAALAFGPMSSRPLSLSFTGIAPRFAQYFVRPSWSIPCEPSSSSSSSLVFPQLGTSSGAVERAAAIDAIPIRHALPSLSEACEKGWNALLPRLESLLELIPPIVLASVPKKKVSHRKKMQKLAGTGLKNKTNLTVCEACGNIRLIHHLCPHCFSEINRAWKADRRTPRVEGTGDR